MLNYEEFKDTIASQIKDCEARSIRQIYGRGI